MDFSTIKKDVKMLEFEILRADCDNFFEAVINKQELEKLNLKLRKFFSQPIYPPDNILAEKVQKVISTFGGIKPGQTLYYKDLGSSVIFAMLWPWGDGERITFKLVER